MGWLTKLYGTTVGLDTAPLIYFIEEHPAYLRIVDPFFEAMGRGDIQVVTSTLTLAEVLVHPYKRGDRSLVRQYSLMLLDTENLETLPVSSEIADQAARIRAAHGVKTPDSIQLANSGRGNLVYAANKITSARHSSKKIAIMEFHAFHDKVEAFPQFAILTFGKYPNYVTGFCDFHAEVINVRNMLELDPNWTGRATNGVLGWGIEGQDVP